MEHVVIHDPDAGEPIPGLPGYLATRSGRIISTIPWRGMTHHTMSPVRDSKRGYMQVQLRVSGKVRSFHVHRLVAAAFLPKPKGHQLMVRHINGDPSDNRVQNLAWGTAKDNYNDSVAHGTNSKGSLVGTAKLTEKDVLRVWEMRSGGKNGVEIANVFGVNKATVNRILSGKSWKHVGTAYRKHLELRDG